jgi:DNA polymerase III subunit epsilon
MDNILFFDTETTGFYNDKLPPGHDAQPHIVQLAAQLCQADGKIIAGFSLIVGLSGQNIEIPAKASAVHGITTERSIQFGVSLETVLSLFAHLYSRAGLIVAHNMKFDQAVIETAIARYYGKPKPLSKPLFCTMEAAAPIVNLPPTERMLAAGFNKPKAPKLEECIRHFFSEELTGAHDAMIDVEACKRVYFHIMKSYRIESCRIALNG